MKFLLIITTCLLGSYAASACKCAPSTLADRFNKSSVVVLGSFNQGNLEVLKTWKGGFSVGSKIAIPASSSSCAYNFANGKNYIVFSNDNGQTSLCSGNIPAPTPDKENELDAIATTTPAP